MFNRRLVRRQSEEQFVEASHVFTCFRRAILLHVLRQREHQALAVIQDIDFLTLLFGKVQRQHHRADGDKGAERYHYDAEQPDLPKGGFNVF